MDNFLLFIRELFDIGNSSGSLLAEALGLFKTFQRIGATKTFSAHFSDQCYKMFSWAINIIEILKLTFYFRPLSDYEIFYIYIFAIPMAIITYVVASLYSFFIFLFYILYAFFLMIGVGFGYINYNKSITIGLLVTALILVIIIIILLFCGCDIGEIIVMMIFGFYQSGDDDLKEFMNVKDSKSKYVLKVSFALSQAFFVFSILIIPILKKSSNLTKIYSIGVIVILTLCTIIEGIVACVKFYKNNDDDQEDKNDTAYISIGLTCFSLIIIPSTKYFMIVNSDVYKNNWRCYIGFILFALIIPISITTAMIIGRVPFIVRKYRNHYMAFGEIVDIVRQVVYAIVAALDIPWACIGLEIAWIILIFISWPYKYISEYVLQSGNSLVVIIETSVCLAADRKGTGFLTFKLSLILVIIACLPAIFSLIIFFLFDFGYRERDKGKANVVLCITVIFRLISPFAWLFYGFGVALIDDALKNL